MCFLKNCPAIATDFNPPRFAGFEISTSPKNVDADDMRAGVKKR